MKQTRVKLLLSIGLVIAIVVVGVMATSALSITTPAPARTISVAATGSNDCVMSLKGAKSGVIGTDIRILTFSHSIVSPRDIASGLPTGQRQHKLIIISKLVDKTSPLLMNVLCTNENLPEVTFTFSNGARKNVYQIKLTNANIASVDLRKSNETNSPLMEEIALTYQKIEWTWLENGTTAMDDWEARN